MRIFEYDPATGTKLKQFAEDVIPNQLYDELRLAYNVCKIAQHGNSQEWRVYEEVGFRDDNGEYRSYKHDDKWICFCGGKSWQKYQWVILPPYTFCIDD